MARFFTSISSILRQPVLTVVAAAALALPALSTPSVARGPEAIADTAEKVIDAVVNISTSQAAEARSSQAPMPQLPPGSPFEEFFEEFFKNRRGDSPAPNRPPRRVSSLGSGFVIDPSGIVVTNNHVISYAVFCLKKKKIISLACLPTQEAETRQFEPY